MPHSYFKKSPYSPKSQRSVDELRREMLKKYKFTNKRPKYKKPTKGRRLLKRLLPYFFIIVVLFFIFAFIVFAWYARELPNPNQINERNIAQSTKIYDRTGETLLYEIHGDQKRTLINLDQIPNHAVQATIAVEDKNFYKHRGISFLGITRAIIVDILRGGKASQGGSTLTQQFVKNAILTNEKKISRKIKEWVLSYEIEKKFTKDEILKMYFNEIPYGSTAYGIESAAMMYFDKSAKDLTLGEATVLAALPQAPSYYSPYGSHKDELISRQHYILDLMVEQNYISRDQAETAKQEELKFKQKIDNIKAPHFVFFVKEYLSQKYGERLVEQGGLKVITSLDWDKQQVAEEEITKQAEKNLKYEANNAGLVSLDIKTGQILAMVGSKDFFNEEIDGQVNVTLANRQPGSSFKPVVYAQAFETGYTPDSMIFDLKTTFAGNNQSYTPLNYTGQEYGPVTLRQALSGSLNITAVKLLYLVGIPKVIALAEKMGYSTLTEPDRYGLSLVLGGGEVKLLEHANAFSAFAREGIIKPINPLLKVEDSGGKVLEEFAEQKGERVLSINSSRMINSILSDNNARSFIFGANNYLTLGDQPVAAKTGTTNDNKDAWTIGYTPSIITGVWVGNNDGKEMKAGADGSVVAAPIWRNYMQQALAGSSIESFNAPDYENSQKPMIGGKLEADLVYKIDQLSGLLATENTPLQLIIEKTFKQVHSVLYYVNKEDPLGPIPSNPENDPYFLKFEEPVQKWAEENGYNNNEKPPTEYDNIHRAEDRPTVTMGSPLNNQTITTDNFNVSLSAYSTRGIVKAEYYIDNQLLTTGYSQFSEQNINLPYGIANGYHQLKASVFDDLGNTNSAEINININRENSLEINWLKPATGTVLKNSDFPYELILYLNQLNQIKKVDFYFRNNQNNQSQWINYRENPIVNNLSVFWTDIPAVGSYKLYPVIQDINNNVFNGPEIAISIEE